MTARITTGERVTGWEGFTGAPLSLPCYNLDGVSSTVELVLPPPTTHVPVRISGNASTITVRLAAATAIEVRQGRGVANVAIDGAERDATGNKPYQTPDYAQTAARYAFEVTARLSTVTITSGAASDAPHR
jgi:hypothetical protein